MTARAIVLWPDPGLTAVCRPALDGGATAVVALIQDLFDSMYAAHGRGLAAPQIGVPLRVFVMDTTWKDGPATPCAFVDPVIWHADARTATHDEACLSIPGASWTVTRPAAVTLGWRDPDGTAREGAFDGFTAACVQHEIDHLDGRLINGAAPA